MDTRSDEGFSPVTDSDRLEAIFEQVQWMKRLGVMLVVLAAACAWLLFSILSETVDSRSEGEARYCIEATGRAGC